MECQIHVQYISLIGMNAQSIYYFQVNAVLNIVRIISATN